MGRVTNKIDHILIGDDVRVYSMYDIPGELTMILITAWWWQKPGKEWRYRNKTHTSSTWKDLISGN